MSEEERYDPAQAQAIAEAYDAEARATGYPGPEIAFGMIKEYVLPGQSMLDIGIGTGLASDAFRKAGVRVHGMDISQEMLDACRWKGFKDLTRHDLTCQPYPYASESFDHVTCWGVFPFFCHLSPVFTEAERILKPGGTLVFMTADRTEEEAIELVVGPEYTGTGESVTLYCHSRDQISRWLEELGFTLLGSLPFPVYMDHEKKESMQAKGYVAKKATALRRKRL